MQVPEAVDLLDKALHADRKNVRATMLSGDAQLAQGDVEGALMTWRRVEQQSVPHVALVAARLMDGYRKVGRPQEGVNLLRSYLAEASSIDLIEVVFKAVIELDGVEAAKQLVVEELRRNPTLLGLDKLLEARLMDAPRQHLGRAVDGEEPGARLHPEAGALPVQPVRLQGAPVLLAVPGLQPLGDLPAAPHRRTQCNELI